MFSCETHVVKLQFVEMISFVTVPRRQCQAIATVVLGDFHLAMSEGLLRAFQTMIVSSFRKNL